MLHIHNSSRPWPRRVRCSRASMTESGRNATVSIRRGEVAPCMFAQLKDQSCATDPFMEAGTASDIQSTVTDADLPTLAAIREEFAELREVLSDVPAACAALPEQEQQRYRDAQQSVVDARRSAQTNEGLLQVC